MTLIAVTRLRLRSIRFLLHFGWLAYRSGAQARGSSGHIESRVLNDANFAFWTMSAWKSEPAMRAFVMSGVHRGAMIRLREICDEASVVHWTQETAELPDWLYAHRRMVAEGRPSNVRHPSAAHLAGVIAEPRV